MVNLRRRARTVLSLSSLILRRPASFQMLVRVRQEKLTFLGLGALSDLALAVDSIERHNIPGMLIEAGCALGGSAILMTAAKSEERPFAIYDTFEMIPAPSAADDEDAHQRYQVIKAGQAQGFAGETYYGYMDHLVDRVRDSFSAAGFPIEKNHVAMIKGLIEETMHINQSVALAHIDCDWYSPVMACLEQIVPHLSPGGRLVIDDYAQWSGARKAVDEYFAGQREAFEFLNLSRLHIVKKLL